MQDIGYYVIGGLGLVAWVAVIWVLFGRRRGSGDTRALTERLDALDARLAAVEKTLNDIP